MTVFDVMTDFVMLSHVDRREARDRSLLSLREAGVGDVPVIGSYYRGPNPDAEVRARAYDALAAVDRGRGVVFLEDDIEVRAELFHRHVALAVEADVAVAFCAVNARHYPPGTLDQPTLPVSLAPIPGYAADRGFHGSMAVYLPPAMVAYGLDRREEFQEIDGSPLERPVIPPDFARRKVTGFDFWLKHTARRFGGMLVALPNSVNHVSRHGTWPSLTYHVPEAARAA